jgi:hypothetical protein
MRWKLLCLVLLMGAGYLFCCAGCHGGRVRLPETGSTLEGTVTYGTEKVLVAQILVWGDNVSAEGYIQEDGRYKVENAPIGEVKIGVNVAGGTGQLRGMQMAGKKVPKVTNVPDKYADPTTSGITTTTNKGSNTFDIVIPK